MTHIVIIGNGIAGVTTARHVRKGSDARITIISSESEHFYSRPALMYIYMGHMRYEHTKPYEDWFWRKNRIALVHDRVTHIDTDGQRLRLERGEAVSYDRLVIATGSESNRFNWPGQGLAGVQGFYSLQDLHALERRSQALDHAVIVGGGLIGVEVAEMLHTRGIHATFLIREEGYWRNVLPEPDSALVSRHIAARGVTLHFNTELDEILADDAEHVRAVRTKDGREIPCRLVALCAGVSPNVAVARSSGIPCGRGVLVNQYFETPIPHVYAVGDCAEIRASDADPRGHVEQLWYTGRMHGETLAQTLCGQRTAYQRGVWFNSAKFFDLEYQTYGKVPPEPQPGAAAFYWEDPERERALHFVYEDDATRAILGVNAYGIRYRHVVWDRWIRQRASLEHVLEHLGEAVFDPELTRAHQPAVLEAYRAKTGRALQVARSPGLFSTAQFRPDRGYHPGPRP